MMPPDKSNAVEPTAKEAELLSMLRLHLVNGIGPRHSQLLLDHFGSAGGVLDASLAQLEDVAGVGPKIAMSIAASKLGRDAEIELEEAHSLGVKLLRRGSADYPK
ncbi:MAG: DNA protecting protein DprA, partial [Planctomycetota bacterium]